MKPTIGTNFKIKDVEINNIKVRLNLWDIGGHKKFQNIWNAYFRGANGLIGIYDLNDNNTLKGIREWYNKIKLILDIKIPIILIGNKSDLEKNINVSEVDSILSFLECPYFETSALNGYNIEESFKAIAELCINAQSN